MEKDSGMSPTAAKPLLDLRVTCKLGSSAKGSDDMFQELQTTFASPGEADKELKRWDKKEIRKT